MNNYYDSSEKELKKDMKNFYKEKEAGSIKKTPQLENGYTRIANELYEATMQESFSGYELRVLHAIIRKTYGFGKKTDYIAFSQITILTKIAKSHVSRTVKSLMEYGCVTKLGNKIGINKDLSQWSVTKLGNKKKALNVLPKLVQPVTKLGIEKLPKSALQKKKETITKETNILPTHEKNSVAEIVKEIEKEERIKTEHQALGLELWSQLGAPDNKKSEFIRIMRDYPRSIIDSAYSFARDYPYRDMRWKMFFKRFNDLLKVKKEKDVISEDT